MRSLRARLTTYLLLATVAVSALVGWITFHRTLAQNERLFDYQLREMALSLRAKDSLLRWQPDGYLAQGADTVAEIIGHDGQVMFRTDPAVELPIGLDAGFNDVAVDGLRWRVFRLPGPQRVVQVGQPWQVRRRIALRATLHSLAPLLALVPAMGFFIWWLIGREFQAVRRLEKEVIQRDAHSLQPVSETGLPSELAPVAHALNLLLDRLDRALSAQRAFIGDAAHELRSPATALQLQVETLEQELGSHHRPEALGHLREGARRMGRLIEQLLAAAATDPAEHRPAFRPVELAEALRLAIADCFALAQDKQIALSAELPDSLTVEGDPDRLRILIRNLLDNAIRYTPDGGRVAVGLDRREDEAILRFEDSGPGIAPDERQQVCRRFYRGRSAGQPGNGLGLAIVCNVAQSHGGRVELDTSSLGGLRVGVSLPLRQDRRPSCEPVPGSGP